MKLIAPCKDYIWGGTRLRNEFGKTSNSKRIAESWELSCHPDGESVIANGEFSGKTLTQAGYNIPILIKLIDAEDNLSIQVHPNDEQGKTDNDNGKTEMWYIIDHAPDAELIYGFKHELTQEEFRERIKNNTLLEVVNRVKVKKGDIFFIPAGTLHAIGKGILIAEIQQCSNLTYRVYDYMRTDKNGNPRELHIEKALQVTELKPPPEFHNQTSCEYFNVNIQNINGEISFNTELSFNAILVLNGEIRIDNLIIKKGETCFVPEKFGNYTITGNADIIITEKGKV